jgi:hypothetical protein
MTGPDAGAGYGSAYRSGWYPDPAGRFDFRYHNGAAWTADVSRSGIRYVDPLGLTPPATRAGDGNSAGKGLGIAAMVLGIAGIMIAWLPFVFVIGTICALVAIVMGFVALRGRPGRGFAVAGIVTGVVAVLVSVAGAFFSVAVINAIDAYENPAAHEARITDCGIEGTQATARGQVKNLSGADADFVVSIEFVRPGTDIVQRSANAFVDDVPAGTSAPFELTRAVSIDDVECKITRVSGPLPFGIEISP